jgi:hypothetical protein
VTVRSPNPVRAPESTGRIPDRSAPLPVRPSPRLRSNSIESPVMDRVRGEFLEMPGLSPTLAQASRLFALSMAECEQVLDMLLGAGFLKRCPDGQYRLI